MRPNSTGSMWLLIAVVFLTLGAGGAVYTNSIKNDAGATGAQEAQLISSDSCNALTNSIDVFICKDSVTKMEDAHRRTHLLSAVFAAGIALMLMSPVAFVLFLIKERGIANWHQGKIIILWLTDILLFVLFHTMFPNEPGVAMVLTLPTTLAVVAITWKWLSARERSTVAP